MLEAPFDTKLFPVGGQKRRSRVIQLTTTLEYAATNENGDWSLQAGFQDKNLAVLQVLAPIEATVRYFCKQATTFQVKKAV